jgi:hypothetical protein
MTLLPLIFAGTRKGLAAPPRVHYGRTLRLLHRLDREGMWSFSPSTTGVPAPLFQPLCTEVIQLNREGFTRLEMILTVPDGHVEQILLRTPLTEQGRRALTALPFWT